MSAYAAGDRRAFGELFVRLAPRVHRFLRRSFDEDTVVEALTQSTFLELHDERRRYDPRQPLRLWVLTLAAGIRRDELRRRYRLPARAEEDEIVRVENTATASRDVSVNATLADAMHAAIERLPESQRVVFHLHRCERLTLAEIASVLGTTSNAVRLRARRAYESLSEALHAQMGNAGR